MSCVLWTTFGTYLDALRVRNGLMNADFVRCTACNALLPAAKSSAIAWASGITVTGIGLAAAKTTWGKLLVAGIGLAAGLLVDRLAQPICGDCRIE
jgi:hypothetical protein